MKFSKPKDDKPKQDKPSRFSYEYEGRKIKVTDARTKASAEVYEEGGAYRYRNFESEKPMTPEREAVIGAAMADWYYYVVVKKNAFKP